MGSVDTYLISPCSQMGEMSVESSITLSHQAIVATARKNTQ